jgi:hypothetical protein
MEKASCRRLPVVSHGAVHLVIGYLRNREGNVIWRFDGQWLRDGHLKLVAQYDAGDNRTRDKSGRIIGDGDQRQLGKDQAGV